MKEFFKIIKILLGEKNTRRIRPFGHGVKAYLAALRFGFPGRKITLIGINGTKGKTTTTLLTARLMNKLGLKTGFISGALINDGKNEYRNTDKVSTPDAVVIQKTIRNMVKNGCKYAVIELTSQGLEQRRHLGLGKFDVVVFLNAFPEHLEAHGGWGKYIQAKSLLFQQAKKGGTFIGNHDPSQFETTLKLFNSIPYKTRKTVNRILVSSTEFKAVPSPNGFNMDLEYNGKLYPTLLQSAVEIVDLFYATKIARLFSEETDSNLAPLLRDITGSPGRMDWVIDFGKVHLSNNQNQNSSFSNIEGKDSPDSWKRQVSILVDYAHEPESMRQLMATISSWKAKGSFTQVIHILSSDGAGRDNWKRPILGDLSYQNADLTILTTDNYSKNDNPQEILDGLSTNFSIEELNKKYYKIEKRRDAFQKALELAKIVISNVEGAKVLIVSTGVGTESGLTQPEGVIEWDEKTVWLKLFEEII